MILLAFEPAPLKIGSFSLTVHSVSLKKTLYVVKILLSKHIVQITPTSVKGKHSVDAEVNAESFEHSYFQWTETIFVVQISQVGH